MLSSWRMYVTGARFENLKNNTISSSLMLFSSCDLVWFLLPGLSAGTLPCCESKGLLLLWNHKPKCILPSDALVMGLYHSNREITQTAVFVSAKNSTAERHSRTSPFLPPLDFPCLIFNPKDIWTHKGVLSLKNTGEPNE